MIRDGGIMRLLFANKEFIEYEYQHEKEFEEDIVKNSKELFGKKTIYINIKKRLKGKYGNDSIPDGYLFDYTYEKNPRLYFVENELKGHSVRDHIGPQLLQFALNYKFNMHSLKNIIIESINNLGYNLDLIAVNAGYRNSDDMLTDIISKNDIAIIIPVDEITDELREAKSLFRFKIELLEFKKFVCEDSIQYAFEPFNIDSEVQDGMPSEDIDTIIVPAEKEGFNEEFINNNCWYAISIGINKLDKIKYIAAYQKSPIGAITHYAEISNIDLYKDTGKYIIYFKDKAVELKNPIKLNKNNPSKAPQGRVYTSINKILNANENTTLDDIF